MTQNFIGKATDVVVAVLPDLPSGEYWKETEVLYNGETVKMLVHKDQPLHYLHIDGNWRKVLLGGDV